ncbi:hypothetical protein V8G54_014078 [Vigna mungo]|uniref:Transposase-associated domain-containing protein n=1 Tax=Vigna mungo TaxID=3915 RepID=A0AAQ3NK03_VIGMU
MGTRRVGFYPAGRVVSRHYPCPTRSVVISSHVSEEYEEAISELLQYAQEHAISVNITCYCLYVRCLDQIHQDFGEIRDHMFIFDIIRSYTIWTCHGEVLNNLTTAQTTKCKNG